MTRARMVPPSAPAADASVPSDPLTARFDAVRHAVITAPRDHAALRGEIIAMREKMRAAHPIKPGLFDVKHSPGGMVDVEFVVQFLVLAHSGEHPELRGNLGNIALLQRAEAAGLLPPGMGQDAANAYRELRHIQHRARLDEAPPQIDAEPARPLATAVLALWAHVLG